VGHGDDVACLSSYLPQPDLNRFHSSTLQHPLQLFKI
jgi:hypothetical protein